MKRAMIILQIAIASCAFAQPSIAWKKAIVLSGDQQMYKIDRTADGGFVMGAWNTSEGFGRCFVVRIDSTGDTLWTFRPGSDYYQAEGVASTMDGGCIVAGSRRPMNIYAIKLDSLGQMEWTFQDPYYETHGRAIQQTSDGGYILVGDKFFAGQTPYTDPYVIRLSSSGDTLWTRHMGSPWNDYGAFDVLCMPNGDCIIAGSIDASQWHPGAYCAKLNSRGSVAWAHSWSDDEGYERLYTLCQRPDGIFVTAGLKYLYSGNHGYDLNVRAMNGSGTGQWVRVYGGIGTDAASGIAPADNNGVVIAGSTQSNLSNGLTGSWILGLDNSGNQIWSYEFTGSYYNFANDVIRSLDGGYLIGGAINTGSASGQDIWLIKLCPPGSDAAHPERIDAKDEYNGFRLVHESGQTTSIAFAEIPAGVSARVSGNAAASWTTLLNGDGNDGDSIIFVSSVPMTSGSVDTFWISHFDDDSVLHFSCGCRSDTIRDQFCCMDSVQFSGGEYNGYVHLQIVAFNAHHVASLQIQRRETNNSNTWTEVAFFPVIGNDFVQQYSFDEQTNTAYQYRISAQDSFGGRMNFDQRILTRRQTLDSRGIRADRPDNIGLYAYPNPFNPTTTLSFTLPKSGYVDLNVFDITGRMVCRLAGGHMGPPLHAGENRIEFDGRDLPSGIYFARLQSGEFTATQKLLLLK